MRPHLRTGWIVCSAALTLCASPAALVSQQQISTPDGRVSLTLPPGYAEVELNPLAEFQFADTSTGAFFMLLAEPKEDLFGWNLTRHSMITLAQILTATDFPEVSGPASVEVAGHPALQYRFSGVTFGTQIVSAHTTIDTPTDFVQVLAWSQRSKWESNEPVLRGVLESLEFSGSAAPGATSTSDPFSLVPGTWVWEDSEHGCSSDTQTYAIAEDRRSMTITHSEPYERSPGVMVSVTNYVIDGSSPLTLHTQIADETEVTEDGRPVKWDLVVLARDRFVWHRGDWPEGQFTKSMLRCDETPA